MKQNNPALPLPRNTGIQLYRTFTSSYRMVCFKCRLCFHAWTSNSVGGTCNTCKGPVLFAGTAFRAPRRANVKEWAKLEVLIRNGMRFHYFGGNGILPSTKKAARNSITKRASKKLYVRRNAAGKVVAGSHGSRSSYIIPIP